jgi:aryl-alcohol dehydrogenase-like predicted oxidoreductase
VRRLKPIADELGITRAQLAIAWTLRQPGVTCAITGATKLRQLEDTLQAVEIELDDDVSQRINAIVSPVAQ